MKNENDNEERLIETIVTIGSLIFFAFLTMYAMRGCSGSEGIKGDLTATAVATTATAATAATAIAGENSVNNEATGLMTDVNGTADENVTVDTDANATTDADANATTDAAANATTDANAIKSPTDAKGTSEADEEAGIIADISSDTLSVKPYVLKGIYFRSGSSILTKKSKRQLDSIAKALKKHKKVKITLRGHTDSKGSQKENQALSIKRASSVGLAFVDRGVNIDNIWIDGMGETEPLTKNGTAKEMLRNRRVDIAVSK